GPFLLLRLAVAARERGEWRGERRELGRDDPLRRRRGAERLQRFEVLQRHRSRVGVPGGVVDLVEREAEAFGAQDLRLALTLGLEDVRLLVALGQEDGRLLLTLGLEERGATVPLG